MKGIKRGTVMDFISFLINSQRLIHWVSTMVTAEALRHN